MSEKLHVLSPPPPFIGAEDPQNKLQERELEMHKTVLEHFSAPTYVIPDIESGGELMEQERFWLSYECLLRYLRASKWKVPAAIQRLEDTLKWRREFGLYDTVTAAHVEPEALTGKEVLFGFDKHSRPGFYMFPSRQNTEQPPRQIEFAFWMLERSIDLMPPGVENIALLINFADRAKNPAMGTARTVLNILQTHYPERLGLSLISNVPFLVNAFFKIITPFIDPVTRAKMKFNPDLIKDDIFAPEQVMVEWGGSADFEYVHGTYWPALLKLCEVRRNKWEDKWRSLGGHVGIKEWDYKCGGELKTETDGENDDGLESRSITPPLTKESEIVPAVTQDAVRVAA